MKDIEKNVHTMDLKELIKEETFDFIEEQEKNKNEELQISVPDLELDDI
jgi:hypothetical protein